MGIDTKELLNKISKVDDIQSFLSEYEREFITLKPVDFLNDVLSQKALSLADVARESGQGEYVYKVFRGERKPSREVLISIAVGMHMDINETQLLLRVAKVAILDPRDRRDSVILYSLKEGHTIVQLNDLLYELGKQTL